MPINNFNCLKVTLTQACGTRFMPGVEPEESLKIPVGLGSEYGEERGGARGSITLARKNAVRSIPSRALLAQAAEVPRITSFREPS
jgi:hypothetical protein